MSHTPPIFINHGKNTVGYFTTSNPQSLIIFVHGFNGSATDTWDEFPALIKESNEYANSDVVFYGYESLKGQVNNNALRFYNFLKIIAEGNSNRLGYTRNNLAPNFNYYRILIVAHSLGSIVVRRALLNAKAENKTWLLNTKMILFAPAHRGARIQNLVSESLPTLGRIFAGLGFITIPVLDDLRPNSQTILNLIQETEQLIQQNQGDFTISHTVIWANNEIVVHNERFCQDPVAVLLDNKSHTKVCKPISPNFLTPFEIVTEAL
ncbi:MAG: alpha/beta hydrolase [Saprospiraceae bacterium]